MKKNIIILGILFCFLISCNYQNREKNNIKLKNEDVKLKFDIEKVIIINLDEVCLTYFKVKIDNPSDYEIVLQDNSLRDALKNRDKPKKKGFYLKNTIGNDITPLGIDNYYFFETGKKNSSYYFICASNLENTFEIKDSLQLRKRLARSLFEYNGKNFDLNKIKKSEYIHTKHFERFIKNKNNYVAYKDSVSIKIPKNIEMKYLDKMPISKADWDRL